MQRSFSEISIHVRRGHLSQLPGPLVSMHAWILCISAFYKSDFGRGVINVRS